MRLLDSLRWASLYYIWRNVPFSFFDRFKRKFTVGQLSTCNAVERSSAKCKLWINFRMNLLRSFRALSVTRVASKIARENVVGKARGLILNKIKLYGSRNLFDIIFQVFNWFQLSILRVYKEVFRLELSPKVVIFEMAVN